MKRRVVISFLVGLAVSFAFVLLQDVFNQEDTKAVMKIFTDSFFCVGVFMTCLGAIAVCSDWGAFDSIKYSTSIAFGSFFKRNIDKRKYKTYADYKEAVHDPKVKKPVPVTLISGPCVALIGLVFLIIYYSV